MNIKFGYQTGLLNPENICERIVNQVPGARICTMIGDKFLITIVENTANLFINSTSDLRRIVEKESRIANPEIMIAYAEDDLDCYSDYPVITIKTNETDNYYRLPTYIADRFARILDNHPSKMFKLRHSVVVGFDYDSGRILYMHCNIEHIPEVEISDFRHIIESIMILAASECGCNTDFEKEITDKPFELYGCYKYETYGLIEDLAEWIINQGYADKVELEAYKNQIGINCFGTEYMDTDKILEAATERWIKMINGSAYIEDMNEEE